MLSLWSNIWSILLNFSAFTYRIKFKFWWNTSIFKKKSLSLLQLQVRVLNITISETVIRIFDLTSSVLKQKQADVLTKMRNQVHSHHMQVNIANSEFVICLAENTRKNKNDLIVHLSVTETYATESGSGQDSGIHSAMNFILYFFSSRCFAFPCLTFFIFPPPPLFKWSVPYSLTMMYVVKSVIP